MEQFQQLFSKIDIQKKCLAYPVASYLPLHMVMYPLSMWGLIIFISVQFSRSVDSTESSNPHWFGTLLLNFPSPSPIELPLNSLSSLLYLIPATYSSHLSSKLTGLLHAFFLYIYVCVYISIYIAIYLFWLLLLGLFSSCDLRASHAVSSLVTELRLSSCGHGLRVLWWHMESSQTQDQPVSPSLHWQWIFTTESSGKPLLCCCLLL